MKRYIVLGVILLLTMSLGCISEKSREEKIRQMQKETEDHPEIPWWDVIKVDSNVIEDRLRERLVIGNEGLKYFIVVEDPRLYNPRGYIYSMFDVIHDYLFDHVINTPTSIEMSETVYIIIIDKSYDIGQYEKELNEWRDKYE